MLEESMPAKTARRKTAPGPARKTAKKVTPDDAWVTIREIGEARKETGAAIKEMRKGHVNLQKAHAETETALKGTRRIAGDLDNKFGDEAEYTLIPGLPEKFKQFGFDFGVIDPSGEDIKVTKPDSRPRAWQGTEKPGA
jgi:hypothetical protein